MKIYVWKKAKVSASKNRFFASFNFNLNFKFLFRFYLICKNFPAFFFFFFFFFYFIQIYIFTRKGRANIKYINLKSQTVFFLLFLFFHHLWKTIWSFEFFMFLQFFFFYTSIKISIDLQTNRHHWVKNNKYNKLALNCTHILSPSKKKSSFINILFS